VIGAAGGQQKVSLVKDLGATNAVDYLQPQWANTVRGAVGDRPVTLALDGVGGKIGRDTLELLGTAGRLVLLGSSSGTLTELSAADIYSRGITISAAIGKRILQRPGGLRPSSTTHSKQRPKAGSHRSSASGSPSPTPRPHTRRSSHERPPARRSCD